MSHTSTQQRFGEALDALVARVKEDRSVLAAILCGSLSHDAVWAKSDIDLVLVTIDDRKVEEGHLALFADGVNVHAVLMPRSRFRSTVEGAIRNSFLHALLAKGRMLYTHDATIGELLAQLQEIGSRDTQVQLLRAATQATSPIYKAHKWLVTRGDLDYTALWILYAATPLAQIEVIGRRMIADREVIPQAMSLNPEFFRTVYTDLLNVPKSRKQVEGALQAVDGYMAERAPSIFAPILDHLRDVGEVRSSTELEDHFKRNFDLTGVTVACEYLADEGLIGKASTSVRITRRSNVEVEEVGFYSLLDGRR